MSLSFPDRLAYAVATKMEAIARRDVSWKPDGEAQVRVLIAAAIRAALDEAAKVARNHAWQDVDDPLGDHHPHSTKSCSEMIAAKIEALK